MSSYKKCSRRTKSPEKKYIGSKSTERKKAFYFQSYKRLEDIIFQSEKIGNISAHTFIVLEWNLIERADNCVGAKVDHISFNQDTLIFYFVKKNTDQEGIKNMDYL